MKFRLWKEYGAQNAKPVFDAFEHSLVSNGHTVSHSANINDADVHVIWSVLFNGRMAPNKNIWEKCQKTNKPIIVLEVGGINRGTTWRVGLNGINRDAYFGPKDNTSERAETLGLHLRPWRENGNYILICGQHDKSLQWKSMPRMSTWVMDTIDEIKKYTDMDIVFRPHPRCRLEAIEHQYKNVYRQEPKKITNTYDDFDISFRECHAVICWSSNPGPQAVMNGVPIFTGPSSIAYEVANHSLDTIVNPLRPQRRQWLNDYAHTEYTVEEIAAGIPLNHLTKRL